MAPEEYKKLTEHNRYTLKSQINTLGEFCSVWGFKPKEFWAQVKIVGNSFKTLKPIDNKDRESLWNEFQNLCEKVKATQEKQNNEFQYQSKTNKVNIMDLIQQAKNWNGTDKSKTNHFLGQAMNLMKSKPLTKTDRDYCWTEWKSAKDDSVHTQSQELNNNYLIVKEKLSAISLLAHYYDAKEALNQIKALQGSLKNYPMVDAHWKDTQESMQRNWNKAKSRLDEYYFKKNQDWHSKQKEYEDRKSNWRSKQEDALQRFTTIVSKNETYINSLRSQIDDLESKIYSGSDSYRDRAQGWISEKQSKIREVQSNNADLESKIQDIRRKLDE